MCAPSWPCEELPSTGCVDHKERSYNLAEPCFLCNVTVSVMPGEGRTRCQSDQLVGTLEGGLDLGSGVCIPMEFKEKERQHGTVFLH